jgi:hypothetical protein
MVDLADRFPVNEFFPIEDTEYAVKYSSLEPNGIYRGTENASSLVLEGTYGYDWGMALEGDDLFINEYLTTDVGLMLCDLVKIDTETMEKTVLKENAILRGRCKSGELVALDDYVMPSNNPKVNSLMKFYSMSSLKLDPDDVTSAVIFIDPETDEIVYRTDDRTTKAISFEELYLERSLDEIREEDAA